MTRQKNRVIHTQHPLCTEKSNKNGAKCICSGAKQHNLPRDKCSFIPFYKSQCNETGDLNLTSLGPSDLLDSNDHFFSERLKSIRNEKL